MAIGMEYVLNRQTAFNRSMLEGADRCGCFHCGEMFSPEDIVDWVVEDDGHEDSAVCPFCGVDAVVVGTATYPLDPRALERLRHFWFRREDPGSDRDTDGGARTLPVPASGAQPARHG